MDSMEQLWWCGISRANRFVRRISETVLSNRNVFLLLPARLPWYDTMHDLAEQYLSSGNPFNTLCTIQCPDQSAGPYLLEHFCKEEKRYAYRPGISYAKFLAQSDDITLNRRYLWVRGVTAKQRKDWSDFFAEYRRYLPAGTAGAAVILELEDNSQPPACKGFTALRFSDEIDPYDRYTFCALASANVELSRPLRPYLAELVSTICGNDLELSVFCIRNWKAFLQNPADVLHHAVYTGAVSADCIPFDRLDNKIWESQIKLLFPLIETYRAHFVAGHREEIARYLPVQNAFGEEIHNPQDVELGTLFFWVKSGKITISDGECSRLTLYREARNKLAHLTPLSFELAETILKSDL